MLILSQSHHLLAKKFDQLFTERRIRLMERGIVAAAILLFLLHLGIIFVGRQLGIYLPGLYIEQQHSYLAAVATPFNVILLFELFLLILAIPDSITRSIGRQYEIISLIILLNVFKEIAKIDDIGNLDVLSSTGVWILLDLVTAIAMFFMVGFFYSIRRKRSHEHKLEPHQQSESFVALKKSMALVLSLFLLGLVLFNAIAWMQSLFELAQFSNQVFFVQLFTLMIFSDVFLLISSYLYTSHYELLMRNIGFILTTILIRISLTLPSPYNLLVALIAMLAGILVHAIYNYFRCFDKGDPLRDEWQSFNKRPVELLPPTPQN